MKSQSGSGVLSKERRTSLYGGSNGNTSAPNSHSTDNSGLSPYGTSVGTSVNNIVISNNLNILTNLRPTPLVQVLNHHNNASTTTTNHNRLHNISQQGTSFVMTKQLLLTLSSCLEWEFVNTNYVIFAYLETCIKFNLFYSKIITSYHFLEMRAANSLNHKKRKWTKILRYIFLHTTFASFVTIFNITVVYHTAP